MGTGVMESVAEKQPCDDNNPPIQLMVCHRQGHQLSGMCLICLIL